LSDGQKKYIEMFGSFTEPFNCIYSLWCRATKFSQIARTGRCVFYGVSHAFVYCTGVLWSLSV